jgi:O-antigen/teichoic acid export membrane protein
VRHVLRLDHPDIPTLIGLVGVQVMVAMAFASFYDLLAGLQENHRASVFQGINRIVGQIASALVAVRAGTAASVIAASVCVTVCIGLVCVVDTWKRHAQAFRRTPIELRELVAQVRTGLKSFGIQVGAAMGGYAPVAAINQVAGPAMVPTFTLPNQIISLAAGVIGAFGGLMLPVFGESWAKGDLAWIQTTLTKLLEKLLLLLAAASAGFLALGRPFLKLWVRLDISMLMLVSVTLIACSMNVIAFLKFMLSGINRHRVAAISELLNGALTLVLTFVVCRVSIDAVGLGGALAGCATSYWLLPREIRRHLGIARVMPRSRSLAIILGIAFAVYVAAALGFALLRRTPHVPTIVAVLGAAVLGGLVFLKASAATAILDWQSLLTRLASPTGEAKKQHDP